MRKKKSVKNTSKTNEGAKKGGTTKAFEKIRELHPQAYQKWTAEEDKKLEKMYHKGVQIRELSETFGRKRGAITARLKKLGLTN
jgi:ribosomal protein L32E